MRGGDVGKVGTYRTDRARLVGRAARRGEDDLGRCPRLGWDRPLGPVKCGGRKLWATAMHRGSVKIDTDGHGQTRTDKNE